MLKVISAAALAAQLLFPPATPGVAFSDANARALGNDRRAAVALGRALFATQWPAQVLDVYADRSGDLVVAGLRVGGSKFHHPMTRAQFLSEIEQLAMRALRASNASEVDIWATQPLAVTKRTVVSGDLALPAWRTVFSVSVRRGEAASALAARLRSGRGVYWDQDWTRSAFKEST